MNEEMNLSIHRSTIDEQRFQLRVARASNVTTTSFADMMAFCQEKQIELLIVRCAVEETNTVHTLETGGFLLMDTLLYYACDLSISLPSINEKIAIMQAQEGDEPAVLEVATQAFNGYFSHYHADPRLRKTACDDVYIDWTLRSLHHEAADEVLVAREGNSVVGFLSLKALSHIDVEGPLFAVLPEAQGKGIGRALMIAAMHWSRNAGAKRMLISTQVTNRASQNIWMHLGFYSHKAFYTFHKWFLDEV